MIRGLSLADVLARGILLLFLWWVLAEGTVTSPLLAIVIVAAALLMSFVLVPALAWRPRLVATARFIPFFLVQSLRGGVDVARRALDPRLPIAPEILDHDLALQRESARVLFVAILNLLPGTLSVTLRPGAPVRIHVLNAASFRREQLMELERHVAALFGE